MAKYKKVDTDLKFVDREKEVEKFWNEEDIFKKSMENRKEGETYTFYDGTSDSKWKTAYRTRSYPCNQRYDPEIPYNEGLHGSA